MVARKFLNDVENMQKMARQQIDKGGVTNGYAADLQTVKTLLANALATELLCSLRYKGHYYKAKALGAKNAADEFLEHAQQEMDHANRLADRLAQLGCTPTFSPEVIASKSHAKYVECETIDAMVRENLVAERIAIDTYRDMIRFIDNGDPTTRKLLEDILAMEEEHADDLIELSSEFDVDLS